jgi:hypothetical protein
MINVNNTYEFCLFDIRIDTRMVLSKISNPDNPYLNSQKTSSCVVFLSFRLVRSPQRLAEARIFPYRRIPDALHLRE